MGKILFTSKKRKVITGIKYGLLYNFWAATDVRKITSSDTWVVPTLANFTILSTALGGTSVAGGKMKETGLIYWDTPNTGATNLVNFNGRGTGWRDRLNGTFADINKVQWFMVSDFGSTFRQSPYLIYNNAALDMSLYRYKKHGSCIRFVRTATAPEQLLADGTACDNYTGNDGKIYRTVKIGTQVWLADNLAETKFRDGSLIPFAGANGINFTNAEWAALTTAGCCPYNNDWNNV